MSFRPTLKSMDMDTILFVRKNRMAYAYHWDYYTNAVDTISKEFDHNPPSAVYFKAGNTLDSWVHVNLSMLDGYYRGLRNIKIAAHDSYTRGIRLVEDMKVNIPNAVYIDADGYEYSIGLNDGSEEFTLREKITAGGSDKDVELSQYSVAHPEYGFEQRHLMDDVKLTFKNGKTPLNAVMTYNCLINPFYLSINDQNVAYIREGLRMSTYRCIASDDTEPDIPLSLVIPDLPRYVSNGSDPEQIVSLRMNDIGTMVQITSSTESSDSAMETREIVRGFIRFSKTYGSTWLYEYQIQDLETDPIRFFIRSGESNQLDPVYTMPLTININSRDSIDAVPLEGVEGGWIVYRTNTDGFQTDKLLFNISINDGATWDHVPYTALDPECMAITVLPYIRSNVTVLQVFLRNGTSKFLQSFDGYTWTDLILADDIPITKLETNQEMYTVDTILRSKARKGDDFYVYYEQGEGLTDSVIYVNTGTSWEYGFAFSEATIVDLIRDHYTGSVQLTNVQLSHAFNYDKAGDILRLAFSIVGTGSGQTTPKIVSGLMISNDRGNTWTYHINDEPVSAANFANGEYAVSAKHIDYYLGKWIILDTQRNHLTGEFDNFTYRISEDFIRWTLVSSQNPTTVNYPTITENLTGGSTPRFLCDANMLILFNRNTGGHLIWSTEVSAKKIFHYEMRVKLYRWVGVKTSQQLVADYIVWDQPEGVSDTERKPIRLGFPIKLNPNAFILLYNGIPILSDHAYVNPSNNKEICIDNAELYHAFQSYINPIQFMKALRDYIYTDFAVINFTSEDATKECYMYCDRGHVSHSGKECYVDFHSDLAGDMILFNGIDHEYIITGKQSIKYTISRYGLHEAVYPRQPYMYIGKYNIRTDVKREVYKIQFVLKTKPV